MAKPMVLWTVTGDKALLKNIKKMSRQVPAALIDSMHEEALEIMRSAQMIVPVGETGNLRRSGYVSEPQGSTFDAAVIWLGFDIDYALPVHEIMTANHPNGQAKFLEIPLQAAQAGYFDRLAARTRRKLKGTF